jgi:hypothetical protein
VDKKILKELHQKAFQYFMDYTNFNQDQKGFGLTVDATNKIGVASIAATGFMLSSLVIGAKDGYITHEEAYSKALNTLKTLCYHVPHRFGFFAHFLDIGTAERHHKTEFSTIDTALTLCGVLTVDAYFNDEEISAYTKLLFDRIEWHEFIFEKDGKTLLRMAYNPDKDGAYVTGKPGFIHQWDMFAEQLMIYFMIAGLIKDDELSMKLYQGFSRQVFSFNGKSFYGSPHNTLFVYHFPLAWLNLKDYVDSENISWFENARLATQSHQYSAILYQHEYLGFSTNLFGCNASDTPKGYRVFGSIPNTRNHMDTDGTISPFSLIGALPFMPDTIYQSILEMKKVENLEGPYGFYDAFNLGYNPPWVSSRYISIDKGLELLMLDAYLNGHVYDAFMNHEIIKKGLSILKFKNIFKEVK